MPKPRPELINKHCDICNELITGKKVRVGRKDGLGLYRCKVCQKARDREMMTAHMRKSLKGPKAEQYKAVRNRAKRAWEQRNPKGKRARGLIKSVRGRLRKYSYDLERFQRPSTKELAKVIMMLPTECQSCGTDQDLTIEHIKSVVDYPELALEPSNLTTLCRPCNTRSYHAR